MSDAAVAVVCSRPQRNHEPRAPEAAPIVGGSCAARWSAGPLHTQTLAYLRMRRMQARIWCFSRTLTIVIFVGLGAISLLGGIP